MAKPTQKLIPFGETPPPAQTKQYRYEPSDEALEAFERLEGWLREGRGRPVDAQAEETLRCLANALLEGKKGWHHAAEDRLKALQADPPSCVGVADAKAFDQTVEDLLDCLHEIMQTERGRGR